MEVFQNKNLLDTNILIDAIRRHKKAELFIDEIGVPNISIITYYELVRGARDKQVLTKINQGIDDFNILELDISDQYLGIEILNKYKLKHGITILDSMIAATAINKDLTLITKNSKHFQFIQELDLYIPY